MKLTDYFTKLELWRYAIEYYDFSGGYDYFVKCYNLKWENLLGNIEEISKELVDRIPYHNQLQINKIVLRLGISPVAKAIGMDYHILYKRVTQMKVSNKLAREIKEYYDIEEIKF